MTPTQELTPVWTDDLLCSDSGSTSYEANTMLVVPRGECSFEQKAYNAQKSGAAAVVIYNTLGSRYGYNETTGTVDYPLDLYDYDCSKGEAQVDATKLTFDPTYNTNANDALMSGSSSSNMCASSSFLQTCESERCVLTGSFSGNNNSTAQACCAWDLHVWLYRDGDLEKNLTSAVTIPSLFVSMQQAHELQTLMQSKNIVVVPYERWRPEYNPSAVLVWALGVFVAFSAAYCSGAEYRSIKTTDSVTVQEDIPRSNSPGSTALMTELIPSSTAPAATQQRSSIMDSTEPQEEQQSPSYAYGEETLELTWHHAVAFLVFSSSSLMILFYFEIYNLVKIMYGFGCSGALVQVIFLPLFERLLAPGSNRSLFNCMGEAVTLIDLLSVLCGYGIGLAWIVIGFVVKPDPSSIVFYWVTQDVMGACMCITFLSIIRLNSLQVATVLLSAAFFYDIFFVFITPLIFTKSVMITVATSGGPPTKDPTWCEKYPSDAGCQGGNPLPMLFTVPRIGDYQGGASLLGLGDIVLPGLLLSLACRLDGAKRLVGLNSGGRGVSIRQHACPKTYFTPCVIAYAIGLMMANVAVYVMNYGQPALLYLVPMCLGTFLVQAWRKNELADVWGRPKVLALADKICASRYQQRQEQDTPGELA